MILEKFDQDRRGDPAARPILPVEGPRYFEICFKVVERRSDSLKWFHKNMVG